MKSTVQIISVAAVITWAVAQSPAQWSPAGPGDVRAPCPMLNALANHGYLPHDGQNITETITTTALDTALNIPPQFGKFLHQAAVRTNPNGNATNTFNLDHLARHDILEHDASLSRQDAFFGDNLSFNQTVFNETRSHWQETIDVQQAAAARFARVQTSNTTNPTFGFTKVGQQFSLGESAAYIIVLGNTTSRTVDRARVEYLFENERLPTEVGWTRPENPPDANILASVTEEIVKATANLTGTTPQAVRRMLAADMHASFTDISA